MAEIFVEFTQSLSTGDGHTYAARACGRLREDGEWEGWIEFVPASGGTPLRTPRETTQPNRQDLAYWATGLTPTYLEGALVRALEAEPNATGTAVPEPAYDSPAPRPTPPAAPRPRPHAVMDPFDVYAKSGETILRQELTALGVAHLRDIIAAYDIHADAPVTSDRQALAELIVAAVRRGAV